MSVSEHQAKRYGEAFLIRSVEKRLLKLFSEGKLFGTVHTCIGQEFSGVAVAEALKAGDLVFSNHRCHGHYIACTGDVEGLIAEVMGRVSGACGGRGGSQHLYAPGFYSNGVQGGIAPVAAGLAWSLKLKEEGGIAVVFIGDGTLGEGVLYETMNIASKWELPLLFVLENNLYAQSTHQSQTLAGDICARAEAFGIPADHADTWNTEKLTKKAAAAVERVRDTGRPQFLQIDTYRLKAHSKGDDNRDPSEVQSYHEQDPLEAYARLEPRAAKKALAVAEDRVASAVEKAEAASYPAADMIHTSALSEISWSVCSPMGEERHAAAIYAGLLRNMERDPNILVFGEDVEAPYGGAFKVTKDLSNRFPERVRNTPISEATIVGLGNGLALQGYIPVVEIMFGDFLTLAADQIINHASKFRYMYNDRVKVPLIIRTPMGGKRGYGPTHSQSLEKHFMGLPDTRMLALNIRQDPGKVYDELFKTIDRVTIVIENKLLYGAHLSRSVPAGFGIEQSNAIYPVTRLRPEAKPDVTILCYGGMLADAEDAAARLFQEHEIVAEVICPLEIFPLDVAPVLESVHRSGRLLIAEEGIGFAAWGAEVISQIAEAAPGSLRGCARIASPVHPIPSSGPLEKAVLPGVEHIITASKELVDGE